MCEFLISTPFEINPARVPRLPWGRRRAKPAIEAHLSDARLAGRYQGQLAQFGTEIGRIRINNHLARIIAGTETASNEFNDDRGALENLCQPLAGESIDACAGSSHDSRVAT